MADSIEDLQKRRDLLKEIKELEDEIGDVSIKNLEKRLLLLKEIKEEGLEAPDEVAVDTAADHLRTLREIEVYTLAGDEDVEAASRYLATLKQIEEQPVPNEDEIKAAAEYLATLKAIEVAA